MYWKDKLYVMWIDYDQSAKIDHAMLKDEFGDATEIERARPIDNWSDISRRFLLQHNARYGETKISYNPYVWQRELIFNTEQDAVIFILKVL